MASLNTVYQERTYRDKINRERFISFPVCHYETDLYISIDKNSYTDYLKEFISNRIKFYRKSLEEFAYKNPLFFSSLKPIKGVFSDKEMVSEMLSVSEKVNIGPMASVAGAFSHFIGNDILNSFQVEELIIENGGDIFMKINKPTTVSVFAGHSVLSEKTGIMINENISPLGICTSAGTVGHSLSFGKADAVVIICKNTLLADAYATKFANLIKKKSDINRIIEKIKGINEIISAVVIKDDKLGICGGLQLIPLNNN